MIFTAAELLAHGQFLQRLPAALFAVRPDGWRRELLVGVALQISHHPEPPRGQLSHPALVRLGSAGTKACGLPVGEQGFQVFFEERLVVKAAVPALAPVGTGEGDVLSGWRPAHFVAFHLHVFDKALPVIGILQRLVDGLDEIQLPTIPAQTGLILARLHALIFGSEFTLIQHTQSVIEANLVVDLSVCQQIIGTLVELVSVAKADAVDHEMVVQMVGVNVCGDHHLEVRELPLGKLQTDGVDLLGCDIVIGREGLDEVPNFFALIGFFPFPCDPLLLQNLPRLRIGALVKKAYQKKASPRNRFSDSETGPAFHFLEHGSIPTICVRADDLPFYIVKGQLVDGSSFSIWHQTAGPNLREIKNGGTLQKDTAIFML